MEASSPAWTKKAVETKVLQLRQNLELLQEIHSKLSKDTDEESKVVASASSIALTSIRVKILHLPNSYKYNSYCILL